MHTSIVRGSMALLGLAVLVLLFIVSVRTLNPPQTPAASNPAPTARQAALIESVGLSEFAAATNTVYAATPTEKRIAEEMTPIIQLFGDGKKVEDVKKAITALTKIVTAYPAYPDAYLIRATFAISAGEHDYERMLSDIDRAIQLHSLGKYASAYDSTNDMYVLRAKVHLLAGHSPDAINDLEKAITIKPSNATSVFNNGGVKPEESSNPTALRKADFDAFIARFPDDHRAYLVRGLFYAGFTTFDEKYYDPALEDLKEASRRNPKSFIVKYFLGMITQKKTFLTQAAGSDISDITGEKGGFKERTNNLALGYFREAAALNPDFADAHAEIAQSLFTLKRYSEAIPYYDRVLELEPQNPAAYNDRGLSKTFTNDYYGAIRDFSKAIELKTSKGTTALGSTLGNSYASRAAAYAKVGDFEKAIADYGRAIGESLRSLVLLMSLPQIRTMYPEFSNIVDEDLIEGLRKKYYPNMSPADFADNYAKKAKPYDEFIVAELYVNRGDAYLAHGRFRDAISEYSRAHHACTGWPIDRWRTFIKTVDTEFFVDTETLGVQGDKSTSVWLKEVSLKSGAYNQQNYECDCAGRRLRSTAVMFYDARGNLLKSSGEQRWNPIAPDTIGEILYRGLCR
ncbi:MAG: tetratricopeptide repeat protein [Acidobacteriia bacterium]|nr:tetratricopeptide repeat protein [Terriglobia bacterium]